MPPKRRTATRTPSQQSTLAFHASTNKVTKSGTRGQQAKKNLVEKSIEKSPKPETIDISVSDDEAPVVEQVETPAVEQPASTPEEDEARTITEKQIKAYWETRKGQNLRLHQGGLTVHDKILIDFDMSNHYGPCVGIERTRRWKRANKLRLDPPIEVLAVLLKEHDMAKKHVERSRVDELLNAQNIEFES